VVQSALLCCCNSPDEICWLLFTDDVSQFSQIRIAAFAASTWRPSAARLQCNIICTSQSILLCPYLIVLFVTLRRPAALLIVLSA